MDHIWAHGEITDYSANADKYQSDMVAGKNPSQYRQKKSYRQNLINA